jgi:hypothetical protein
LLPARFADNATYRDGGGVLDVRRTGERVGAVYAQGVKGPGGRRIAADYEITASEPPRRLRSARSSDPCNRSASLAFAGNGGGVHAAGVSVAR